ncbi:MAG: hypothetical protein JWN01_875 [Patescibacteria group bacterium]|jgi:hypothetical protein|nr:hypothetical protein [Patescibacteria group bacterium]
MKRDEAWLQQVLDKIWDNYFTDVPQENDVRMVFGRRAKRRLGSIGLDPNDRHTSIITINSIFKSPEIPEFVIEATIVHELTHYAHGFNSPLAQAQAHPHAGGVMRREFAERGLLELYSQQKRWLKANWHEVLAREFPPRARNARPAAVKMKIPKPFWYIGD